MVPKSEEPSTSGIVQRGSKLKLNEQYRPCEWLSETRPRKSPYYPQMGDEIVYFMQGHQLYLNMVEIKKLYEINTKELPWNKMQIRVNMYFIFKLGKLTIFFRTTNFVK